MDISLRNGHAAYQCCDLSLLVLNLSFEKNDLDLASETFRAVGYGHSASLWKSIIKAYMAVGYEGILSIENEDPILSGPVGVERAAYVLKNVRNELLGT